VPRLHIGVLALQGGYAAHANMLKACDAKVSLITTPQHLQNLDALVLPGGESTALLKLMAPLDMGTYIKAFAHSGKPILATCAGVILLANTVEPYQTSLGCLDITVKRNAYGRQNESHIITDSLNSDYFSGDSEYEMVFIRAPIIKKISANTTVLATENDTPTLIEQGRIMAATFHPELTNDLRIHARLVRHAEEKRAEDLVY